MKNLSLNSHLINLKPGKRFIRLREVEKEYETF